MLLQHRRTFATLIWAFDVTVLCASAYIGAIDAWETPPVAWHMALYCLATLVVWSNLSHRYELYRSRRTSTLLAEIWVLVKVVVLTTGVVWLLRGLFGLGSPTHVQTSLALALIATMCARVIVRAHLSWLRRHGKNTRNYLFLGRGKTARTIAEDISKHAGYGIRTIGGLSFTGEEMMPTIPGVKNLGTTANLQDLIKREAIDEIIVCPADTVWTTEVKSVLRFCAAIGLAVRLAPDFLGIPLGRATVAHIGSIPAYSLPVGFNDSRLLHTKRMIDIAGSFCGIVLLAPLLAAIAIAIKLTSKGPVFFGQKRVGMNGRVFTMLKFRSMVKDAERKQHALLQRNEQAGPVFKMKDDPRITRVGKALRRFSLDELPQLFNVFVGDMSLVGPRPPLPSEVVQYDWWQRRRLSVRPGLTCTWQVSGRNKISFERWMELDLQYIDGWSLGLDLKLIAKTVKEVLRGGGA